MKTILLASLVILNIIFLAGCGTYRLVEVDVATDLNTTAEVTTVPQIEARIAKTRNIVISYSKEYYKSKKDITKTSVLMSSKGMWITEIEREFVKKGFRVLSRQKYNELLREKEVKASTEVNNLFGADLIIQINSLEYANDANISDRTEENLSIFISDSSGAKLERGRRSEENEVVLSRTRSLTATDLNNDAFMALLDCKIIDAKTGELIIFYRHQVFQLKSGRKTSGLMTYLFKLDNDRWKLLDSTGIEFDQHKNRTPKGINRSRLSNIKIQMVRRVCSDLVNKINDYRRKGKKN
ncbi:MAG: hypothetical protein KOO69_01870 [Victivallales bacterium]|nr:hypothetical protein [Victivallales bacterium]